MVFSESRIFYEWFEWKTNENNIQDLQESLNQATYENVAAEDYLNIDAEIETEAAIVETTTSLRITGKERKRKMMRKKKRKKDLPKNQLWNANSNRIVLL
jgi:hypothetical protein